MALIEAKWTIYSIIIGVVMVVTGSINTLAAKWADQLKFDHPFVQAVVMFLGEFLCLPVFFIVYLIKKYQFQRRDVIEADLGPTDLSHSVPTIPKFNPLIFLPASICDMCATSIMYLGLNLTKASSFQMLRGAVIIFTGLLSVAFLRSVLRLYKWIGMGHIVAGLVLVGMSDILATGAGSDMNGVISGDLLIIMAQIIVAVQMVYEQRCLDKYDIPPLLAVGLEGLFGSVLLSLACIPFYYIHVPVPFSNDPEHRLENVIAALREIASDPLILTALLGTLFSIAFFNFAGISVTKELSATTRMVLDSVRVLVIWAVSIIVKWQTVFTFVWLQLLGFALLITGMLLYNDLLIGPWIRKHIIPWMERKGISTLFCIKCCPIEGIEDQRPLHNDSREQIVVA